ncbi:MAG: ABC transporter ATP-binding protein/permease [Coriobacteriia bacterium]|nr:ABC transporter ATP-binding protein/permease [Coriobacteriia bacterium]
MGPGGGGRGPIGMPTEKAKDFKGAFFKLMRYLGGYKFALVIVMILAAASTVFGVFGPRILGSATTVLYEGVMQQIAGTGPGPDFNRIGQILLTLIALYLASAAFQFVQSMIMTFVSNRICYTLRKDIDEKISRLPLNYFDRVSTGDIMSRITNDVDAVQQNISQSITQVISMLTSMVGTLFMMFSISWIMTLIALVSLPISGIVVSFIVKRSQKHFVNQQAYLGEVNGMVEENYGAHTIVKAFNREHAITDEFNKSNDKLYDSAWRAQFISGLMMPIMSVIGNLGYVLVCIVGAWLAIQGGISIGDIQAFIQYQRGFQMPIVQISQISSILQQTMAGAERIFELLEEEELAPEVTDAEAIDPEAIEASVRFENVRFGYDPEVTVINDFSAEVHPGQKIAIVGHTGAGKTTIVKLLERFYDVDAGSIMIGGHDIREFKRDDLRSMMGMVLQDTWLFNGTIADNIRYGNLDATDEEIRNAATIAQADHFIRTLPNGYQMELNEDATNVSQGQKQLLTIARAVLHDPKILILDEATSSIDTRTELQIQKAMDLLMVGRTSFIIAHRLSTIRNADLILVIENGDIVEQGTHNDLLDRDGAYARMYNSQFEMISE